VAGDGYWFADTSYRRFLLAVLGVAFLFLWAPISRGFSKLFAALGRALLGPTAGSIRVAELRHQRAAAVEDADDRLRRLERDLHDGTQARLVSIAMQLGEAREDLVSGSATAEAAALVAAAHVSTKEALVELREIVRGIHPPALDAGLGIAVRTLAARSSLPVTVGIAPGVDAAPIAPAISSIAYYSIAELLTNILKHASATHVIVSVERDADDQGSGRLRIWVADNGRGGASVMAGTPGVGGTGLKSIAERVASVDGSFALASPQGGPTTVDITLPVAVR
jgi:signal transduction histidine kinase